MSTFFRKVASAFVVLEEQPGGSSAPPPSMSNTGLDSISADASKLLASLETTRRTSNLPPPREPTGGTRPAAGTASSPTVPGLPPPSKPLAGTVPPPKAGASTPVATPSAEPPPASGPVPSSCLQMTAADVFTAANLPDDANSSLRLLKMIAGLSMFAPAQQIVMVRAMDAADPTWNEEAVLTDARNRLSTLRAHLQKLEGERIKELGAIDARIADSKSKGNQVVTDIDKQIAELQALRQEAVQETASAVANLEGQKRDLDAQAGKAMEGVVTVVESLQGLLHFFGASETASPPAPAPAPSPARATPPLPGKPPSR